MKKLITILALFAALVVSGSQVFAEGNDAEKHKQEGGGTEKHKQGCKRECCREEGKWCNACDAYHNAQEWRKCHPKKK